MENTTYKCDYLNKPEYLAYLIEYRGAYLEQMKKIDYACGYTINESFGILIAKPNDLNKIKVEVPAIILIDFREMYVIQESSPSATSGITPIKINPYLNLDGKGVIVGFVDTGIDYLNQDFMWEDGKTKILAIWDQTLNSEAFTDKIYGRFFFEKDINEAIKAKAEGKDPYDIVPSKDEIGHGTKIAGIAVGKGYSKEYQGVAENAYIAAVKLYPSPDFSANLSKNGIKNTVAYNNSEIVVAIEFLKDLALKKNMPLVIVIGVGSTEGSHDGTNLLSRYIADISSYRGIAVVTGTGNEGASEGHYRGQIENKGDITNVELVIPREIPVLSFKIWVLKPSRMSINIISPSGEQSRFILAKINQIDRVKFYYENTDSTIKYYDPENISGNQAIEIVFQNIKAGIWRLQLRGEYLTDGIFNIWLPPSSTLPEGTKFLNPNSNNTLTIPSTSAKVISVAYYNTFNNSIVPESGKGFDINNIIAPNIAAPGIDIITTKPGGGKAIVSGSSVGAAITAGVCALMFQWGIIYKNDISMNVVKLNTYLISGATRPKGFSYPNPDWGYGLLNLEGTFNFISGKREINRKTEDNFNEYYINKLFMRMPKELWRG